MFEKSFRRDFSPKDGAQDMGNFSVGQEPDPPKVDKLEGTSPDALKILGSAGALPSKKNLAIRYSPLTAVFGSAGASPSHFVHRL